MNDFILELIEKRLDLELTPAIIIFIRLNYFKNKLNLDLTRGCHK